MRHGSHSFAHHLIKYFMKNFIHILIWAIPLILVSQENILLFYSGIVWASIFVAYSLYSAQKQERLNFETIAVIFVVTVIPTIAFGYISHTKYSGKKEFKAYLYDLDCEYDQSQSYEEEVYVCSNGKTITFDEFKAKYGF
ncbi:hypothetical protein DKP84_06025 [Acinetobacter pittii]|nr:hypothetical protein DKP84_06025 [Acinetobacter pittii]